MSATYTVKEVAQILGFSTNSIYAFLKEGRIQGVRMGKGRFRIPEAELSRVLHLAKNPQAEMPSALTEPIHTITPTTVASDDISTTHLLTHLEAEDSVSLFDWFIAGVGMITAASMLLYTPALGMLRALGMGPILFGAGFILTIAAIGLCVVDFRAGITSVWRYPFLVSLVVVFTFLTILHIQQGNALYGVVLAMLSLTTVLHMVFQLRPMTTLRLASAVFIVGYPLVVLFYPEYEWFPVISSMGYVLRLVISFSFAIFWIVLVFLGWTARRNHHVWSVIIFSGLSIMLMAISIVHAVNLRWSSTIIFFWIALLLPILPYWDLVRKIRGRAQLFLTGIYSLILFISIFYIYVVYVLQFSAKTAASMQMQSNLELGKQMAQNIITANASSLTSLAQNQAFATSVAQNDTDAIYGYLRTLIEGQNAMAWIQIVDKSGDKIVEYPQISDGRTGENFALRDYVAKTLNSGQLEISDVAMSAGLPTRYEFAFSIPVVDQQKQVVAVLAAFVDMQTIGFEMSKTANAGFDETFRVVDKLGRYIVHEDESKLLTQQEEVVQSFDSIKEVFDIDNTYLMSTTSLDSMEWSIRLYASESHIMSTLWGTWFLLGAVYLLSLFHMLMSGFFLGIFSHTSPKAEHMEGPR